MNSLLVQLCFIISAGCLMSTQGQTVNCNNEITLTASETPGVLRFPSNGAQYGANMNVCWKIVAPQGDVIQLEFLDFKLGDSIDCTKDSLTVTEMLGYSGVNRKLCTSNTPSPSLSVANTLYLVFQSDQDGQFEGFNVTYKSVGQKNGCTYIPLSAKGGFIKYDMNLTTAENEDQGHDICWILGDSTNSDYIVKLMIVKMFINSPPDNPMAIYDGEEADVSKRIYAAANTGNTRRITKTSSSGGVLVTFPMRREHNIHLAYYFAPVEKQCELVIPPGSFVNVRTPETPSSINPQCMVVLADGTWNFVGLNLEILRLGPGTVGTKCVGSVSIFDGFDGSDPFIHQYNCDESSWEVRTIQTRGRAAYVDFAQSHNAYIGMNVIGLTNRHLTNDMLITTALPYWWNAFGGDSGSNSGANSNRYHSPCTNFLALDTPQIIDYPNNRDQYKPNIRFCWVITSGGRPITVQITSMDLQDTPRCDDDFVEFRDGSNPFAPLIGKYCRDRDLVTKTTSSGSLFIGFVSDAETSGRGFTLRYGTIASTNP